MSETNLSILLQKRETIREYVTSFRSFLDNFQPNQPNGITETQLRSQVVVANIAGLDSIHESIRLLDPEGIHSAATHEIREMYFQTIARAQGIIFSACPVPPVPTIPSGSITSDLEVPNSATSSNRMKIKLPRVELPSFSGKLEEWRSFKDTFMSLVHNNDELGNIAKLQYLRNSLKGDALRKIQLFTISEENYTRAWELLVKAYEDERIIKSRHYNLLLNLPYQSKESPASLLALVDAAQQHVESLVALGAKIDYEMLVALIERKLHRSTLDKWEETLKRGVYPDFEDLMDFLLRTGARLSKRSNDQAFASEAGCGHASQVAPPKQPRVEYKRHSFVTSSNGCGFCGEPHQLFHCEGFLKLSVMERIKIVKNSNRCNNCLRVHNAKDGECKFGACKHCGKGHNSLLHIFKTSKSNESKKQ